MLYFHLQQQLVDGMEGTEDTTRQSDLIANMLTQNSQVKERNLGVATFLNGPSSVFGNIW